MTSGKITSAVTLSGVSPKRPFSGLFAFAQNDKVRNVAGRSMIEMLGVLAIIGMLSIGSVFGLRFAFDAIKANNLLNDVRLYAATITHNDYDLDTQEFNPSTEFAFWAEWIEERNVVFAVNAEEVPKGVCNATKNKAKNAYLLQVNGVENGNCNDENNQMKFIMNGQDICSENCSNICCDGICCPSNEHSCVDGKCYLAGDCEEEQNACGAGCCDKGNSCCNGTCCMGNAYCTGENKNECCYTAQTGDSKTCCEAGKEPFNAICCGQDANGLQLVEKDGVCACPGEVTALNTETNTCDCTDGGNYFAAYDVCCPLGYTWLPEQNKCSQLTCPTGDSGNAVCSLDGWTCGFWCKNTSDATEISCASGYCRADLCPEDHPFMLLPQPSSGYYYGCYYKGTDNADTSKEYDCYDTHATSACFSNNVICREPVKENDKLVCKRGLCDADYCTQFGGTYYKNRWNSGCLFDRGTEGTEDDFYCWPTSTDRKTWSCQFVKTALSCATNCTEENPANCCTATDPCNGDGFYHTWYNPYRNATNFGCCWEHVNGSTICKNDSFYLLNENDLENGLRCGESLTSLEFDGTGSDKKITKITLNNGWCEDLGCSEYGGTFGHMAEKENGGFFLSGEDEYGCIYDNGIRCYSHFSSGSQFLCKKETTTHTLDCSKNCPQIAPENCKAWYFKDCAPEMTVDGVTKPKCVYGQKMWTDGDVETDTHYDCFCDGDVDEATDICCPTGQVVQDGQCVVEL